MAKSETVSKEHSITVKNRAETVMSGVCEVVGFSDSAIMLKTTCGDLSIRGDKLNIGQLNTDTGELCVSGKITLMRYSKDKKSTGFFEGLFR